MKLKAKEGNKITDKNRSFFNDFIYVPENYNINDYEEVGYDIWGLFVDNEISSNKVEELSNTINILKKAVKVGWITEEEYELIVEAKEKLPQE